MAPKLFQKPLTATVRERMRAARLEELKAHRAAPPTAQHIASLHRLPWPKAPEAEPAEMAAKKKKRRLFSADFKAKVVARALKGRESGEESVLSVATAEGISEQALYQWILAAKKSNGASVEPKGKTKSDLKSVTRELSEAMEHVAKLKKQLRKMLGDD